MSAFVVHAGEYPARVPRREVSRMDPILLVAAFTACPSISILFQVHLVKEGLGRAYSELKGEVE